MEYINNNNIIIKSKYNDDNYYYYYSLLYSTIIIIFLWLSTIIYFLIGLVNEDKIIFFYVNEIIRIPLTLILFLSSVIFTIIYCKFLNLSDDNSKFRSNKKKINKIMIELNKLEVVVNCQDEIEI